MTELLPASAPGHTTPDFADRNALIGRVESAVSIAARRETFRAEIDRSLQGLREESARTMAMIRTLRTSPLYDRASHNPRYEAGL